MLMPLLLMPLRLLLLFPPAAAATPAAAAAAATAGDADRLCPGGTAIDRPSYPYCEYVARVLQWLRKPRRYSRLSHRAQDEPFQARSFSSASAGHPLVLLFVFKLAPIF
ncbi:hypothetical protein AOQ84DRAFT_354148 [Glonium stellatum]|uniref:Secreted protein n=1 Tax=Glonium stellatum TaxID=574774 RepID=A0A8E2F243_9PEZI|nr:hypothetical protein AOQ84DRAFT_354148 [Glonium stellatum]